MISLPVFRTDEVGHAGRVDYFASSLRMTMKKSSRAHYAENSNLSMLRKEANCSTTKNWMKLRLAKHTLLKPGWPDFEAKSRLNSSKNSLFSGESSLISIKNSRI